MKLNSNIYRIDSFCIGFGVFFTAVAALWLLGRVLPLAIFCGLIALLLFAVGHHYRGIEKRIDRLIQLIVEKGQISISELRGITRISPHELDRLITVIIRHNHPLLSFDGQTVRMQTEKKIPIAHKCDGCGADAIFSLTVDTRELRCEYCNSPMPTEKVFELKERFLDDPASVASMQTQQAKPPNIILLVFLFFFFPPLAVVYLVIYFNTRYSHDAFKRQVLRQYR